MPFEAADLIEQNRSARLLVLKHLEGLKPEQWNWKPYPECKSIRENLTHLLTGDRFLSFHMDGDPRAHDFVNVPQQVEEEYADFTPEQLVEEVRSSHAAVCDQLLSLYSDKPLDTPWRGFMGEQKLGVFLSGLAGESSYHTGQIAFIRMASDPGWDYYAHIYNYSG